MRPGPAQPPPLPLWLRAAEWPIRLRAVVLAVLVAGYFATVLLSTPEVAYALRPFNLLLVLVGGLFFGLRGGTALGVVLVVLNTALYWHDGILDSSRAALSGNLLSIVFGVAAGAIVGRVRDLSLTLRAEVHLREVAERRRDELTALLVHDLKNPLTGIGGHAQLLLEDIPSGPGVESVQYICSASERMTRMVMNLLDITRAEDGQLQPHYQKVEVPRLLNEVSLAVQPQLKDRRQTLTIGGASEDVRMDADPELLRRVLLNLVENAIKYTPRDTEIRLEWGATAERVELCVRDRGPGIPAEWADRVFDKYARIDQTGPARDVSRGLGLHFCKLACLAHGGRIWVEPNAPAGSAFRLELPRTRAAQA